MDIFNEFLQQIQDTEQREQTKVVLDWVHQEFPKLERRVAWNQPIFTDHGTFIVGFSVAKGHLTLAPEAKAITAFEKKIEAAGYSHTKQLMRIEWNSTIDFDLLHEIIDFNIRDKADVSSFWRK